MLTTLETRALTEPIDRRQYREYRKRTRTPGRALWPRVLGLLGTAALILFLSLYVTDWDFDLAPWFAIGIALLFLLSGVLVRRATAKRRRLRYRLDRLARDNGYRLEHDVADPGTPGLLFRLGTKRFTVVRMTPASDPGGLEIGVHARTEAGAAGGAAVVETLYVLVRRPGSSAIVDASPREQPRVAAVSPAGPPTLATLDDLPRAVVVGAGAETVFSYEELGDHTIGYLADVLDLAEPRSWEQIAAVRNWMQSRRS
ncbi:hypothetical protein [Herbiconiux sp. UC225_62]|uniref:hypothetical protein n=1 Tax=Herbiconiux sp. UC225_62 TaxID=3350168 RepID=UPI0036D3EDD0